MSLIVYEVLTAQPDFTEAPQYGIDDDRDMVNSPGGTSFAAWTGHTDRVLRFDFQTSSAEEWRSLREFADRMGGRAGAFYLPSWQHDFELAADVAPGDLTLRLVGHWFADNLSETRPDTLGRVLFSVNHLGQFAVHEITSHGEDGPNDVVGVAEPIVNPMQAGRTVVGFCYLVRLATDEIESEHLSPDTARTTLGFRQVTQTRRLNQTETATGPEVGNLNANQDVVATDEDPLYLDTRATACLGPLFYSVPQSDNHESQWTAAVDGNSVHVTGPFGDEFVTTLYNGTSVPRHISLAFDAGSLEVLAWDLENGFSRVAWRDTGVATRLDFVGISPVLFSTFTIDSTVAAGDATVAVFYLKPQDSTIYCRTLAEDFAVERRYCNSPLAPLRLYRARRYLGRLELVGIDAGHRRARWRSNAYVTPIPKQLALTRIDSVAGDYMAITVPRAYAETVGHRMGAVDGTYAELRVYLSGGVQGRGLHSLTNLVTGDYTEVRVFNDPSTTPKATHSLEGLVTGDYMLVRKTGAGVDSFSVKLQTIAGTYAP